MGFYLRKSVRVGPLRFNFSRSGIGVSAGVPGFRIGTGPRGHYVHAGAHGIYYRATLGGRSAARSYRSGGEISPMPYTEAPTSRDPTLGPEITIGSGSVLAMTDSDSEGLLAELRDRHAKLRLWPLVAVIALAGFALALVALKPLYGGVIGLVALGATACVQQWDQLRKSTVIYYDLQGAAEKRFEALHEAVTAIAHSERVWHIQSASAVLDARYHAGAGAEIRRRAVAIQRGLPPFVKSNIEVPVINLGGRSLYFFPDRLLVYESNSIGAIAYGALGLTRATTRFIESGGVPAESQVVGHTWRYVNKNGTPDRRFNNNRQMPIVLYEIVHLQSGTGLNEMLEVSRVGAGEALEAWLVSPPKGLGSSTAPGIAPATQWWRGP